MTFFTSDLHLGHRNIIRLCGRPFASLEEMDETLIRRWNRHYPMMTFNHYEPVTFDELVENNRRHKEHYLRR